MTHTYRPLVVCCISVTSFAFPLYARWHVNKVINTQEHMSQRVTEERSSIKLLMLGDNVG